MFFGKRITPSTARCSAQTARLKAALQSADAVLVGAGAGLSVSAGFAYDGERFRRYFSDFEARYGFHDMYSGGFCPFPTPEESWAYWSRFIFLNRYSDPPRPVYSELLELVGDKDCFVLTTNVDHCFQKAGFAKNRLFYTQGDYGLWQCSEACHDRTHDNGEAVRRMVEAQGFRIGEGGLEPPPDAVPAMAVPADLIPRCPVCGAPMAMNLRADDTFVQDEGWYAAYRRYDDFVRRHTRGAVLYLELGVGMNTPAIIKFPFWRMTAENPKAVYACVNLGQACCPAEIAGRAVCIRADISEVLAALA